MVFAGLQKMSADAAANGKVIVPIFSASKAIQGKPGKPVTFKRLDFDTCKLHGSFNKDTGVFIVKTAGFYLIQFNGTISGDKSVSEIVLRVNGKAYSNSYCYHAQADGKSEHRSPVVFSTLLNLRSGDWVDVLVEMGVIVDPLFSSADKAYNRFSCFLFSL